MPLRHGEPHPAQEPVEAERAGEVRGEPEVFLHDLRQHLDPVKEQRELLEDHLPVHSVDPREHPTLERRLEATFRLEGVPLGRKCLQTHPDQILQLLPVFRVSIGNTFTENLPGHPLLRPAEEMGP